MENADQPVRETESPEDRLSRLSAASLRINESLDFDTVLQGVLDSARSLTAARYGVMTLLDDAGGVQDFLSSGMTGEEAGRLWLTPERWQLFESLTGISEPMRVPDIVEHVRSLGFTEFSIPVPVEVFRFMASPMFHRGARVGHVFVGDRDDGEEFTRADEEILVMFASQAALVIAKRPPVPGGAAGQGGPGDPHRHLAGGRRRLRHEDGDSDVLQPGGPQDRRQPARPRPDARRTCWG